MSNREILEHWRYTIASGRRGNCQCTMCRRQRGDVDPDAEPAPPDMIKELSPDYDFRTGFILYIQYVHCIYIFIAYNAYIDDHLYSKYMGSLTKQSLKGRKNLNVSDDTYERLKGHGKFGESFDELINRILDDRDEGKTSKK